MVVGASASADTLQVWQTTMECTGRSKASGSTVSVAVSLEGVTVPPPRYSVLSGPHAPTTGPGGHPLPADAGPFPLARGTDLDHSCRADLASGLAGTLYEYTSILREPGGNPLPADAGPFPLFHRTRMFLFVTSVAGDTSGCLGYGTTSGVVAPGVEHAGDGVRLPGP